MDSTSEQANLPDHPAVPADLRPVATRQLVEYALRGHQKAAEELVRRHQGRVRRVIIGLIGPRDAVEDCVRETFRKAFRALETYRPEFAFSTWIRRIAHNVGIDYLRQNKIEMLPLEDATVESVLESLQAPGDDPLQEIETAELTSRIKQVFAGMRRQHWLCYQYHEENGWSYKVIAYILDIREETARQFAHRARVKLRRALQVDWPALAI